MAEEQQQPKLGSTAAAGKKSQQARRPKPEAHNGDEHQEVASDSPSAADAGITQPRKQPVLAKPAPAAAHAVPALSHGAAAVGSKSGVSRTGSIKRHGSTTSRRLQALLASEELSSLSLLGTEGSELPGMCLCVW
jgi:hypothetical protein